MKWLHCVALFLATTASALAAQPAAGPLPVIGTNDNLKTAGRLQDGVLTLALWAGHGRWYPEGSSAEAREVAAFGEDGQELVIPSPLIRAAIGTRVHVTVRNTLGASLRVHGFCERPGPCEPITIPPGATRDVRFTLDSAGTFHYWATTTNQALPIRDGADSQLGGAMIADEAGIDPRERILVMSMIRRQHGVIGTETPAFNGRSWPHNERLNHAVGDTVRWRIINLTASVHAMHLHGFYFSIDAAGDGMSERRYVAGSRRQVVTERVAQGNTFTMSWVPERAGNWIFHCHMLEHMLPEESRGHADSHQAADTTGAGMAGLVLGVHVTGVSPSPVAPDSARRRVRLTIDPDTRLGAVPSYKVDLTSGGLSFPRVNERAAPGPILVLTRGQPVAVEIVNRLNEPTAIHWHGIELESYDDGVANFGGSTGSITPPVAPNETFVARFTPPRAGTFIYHTHWHNAGQLSGGIYGPLVVLEPGQAYDPETDHIVVIGLEGPYRNIPNEPFAINGESKPRPLELKAGTPHRLRFINITGDAVNLTVQLLSIHDPVRWTPVAKDGMDIAPLQRAARQARQQVAVGETFDVELAPMAPRPEGLWLELRRGSGELIVQWPVRVK